MIGVPSKGRAGRSSTLEALRGAEGVVIVVPQDGVEAYRSAYPDAAVLPQEGKGIGGARQTLLTAARALRAGPFWMLDDDLTHFEVRPNGKAQRVSLTWMLATMDSVLVPLANAKIALAGPNFRHRAWSEPELTPWERHLRNFIRVDPAAPLNYWPLLKEDLDATLQVMLQGWHTILLNQFTFDSPQMGTSDGGCREDYDAGLLDVACRELRDKYPGVVALTFDEKNARLTNRVNWKEVRRRQASWR